MSSQAQWHELPRDLRDRVLKKLIAQSAQQVIGGSRLALTASPVDPFTSAPASLEQRWFLQRQALYENRLAWGISAPPEIIDDYNVDVALQALQKLQEQFPLLTTTFRVPGLEQSLEADGSTPASDTDSVVSQSQWAAVRQIRTAEQTLPVTQTTAPLSALLTGVQGWVRSRFEALAAEAFDPINGPLWKVELVSRGNKGVLLLNVCSLIGDGETVYALAECFRNNYAQLSQKRTTTQAAHAERAITTTAQPSEDVTVSHDYLDYALWQQQYHNGNGWVKDLGWWQQRLSGGVPSFWADGREGAAGSRLFEQSLSPASGAKLDACAAQYNTTPYAIMLTVYMHLLSELDGEEDIWVTSPSANRIVDGTQEMAGAFARQVIIRHQLDSELLDTPVALQHTLADTFDHDSVPHTLVHQMLQQQYPGSPLPYRYVFNYRHVSDKTPIEQVEQVDDVAFRSEPQQTETPREEDILLMVMQSGDVRHIHWYMRKDRFSPDRAAKVLHRYRELMTQFMNAVE